MAKKAAHLEPKAGHYGIFAGKSWRDNIRPLVLKFIDGNSGKHGRRGRRLSLMPAVAASTGE